METILKSKYRIAEKIAENPFSLTYKGFFVGGEKSAAAGKPVIIKIYKRGTLSSPLIKSMRQKVRELALINHHGLAKLYDGDYGWQGFYFVREYIEGESLKELLAKGGGIGIERAAEVVEQALETLTVVHEKGIVHAALKPTNIFIDNQGLVRLTDFIIEGEIKESIPQKVIDMIFNAKYASPEELEGRPLKPAADVYSLGLVLYELATGRSLMNVQGVAANLQKLREPSIINKAISDSLPKYAIEILAKALQKDPLLRFRSAEEFRQSLLNRQVAPTGQRNEELAKLFEKVVTQFGGEELAKVEEPPHEVGKLRWRKEKDRNWILAVIVGGAVLLGLLYAFLFGH
ncbi:hypothetical protein A2311_01825 [candidate division WOR-1 bacterium RIFOXYB2_FULL_48_7]|uniref:non-specific serine/threonine protein kinase n=1 Tax=candidate division WOR-1 bacterium RIFOXYB2_FULL_48_7 TaxID=1802583 RepID=A0A1F4TD70_UNCSA|nr:MAG: hypothetical protein A2311_01825 [candidate division WOR-1 bacterium RIFOXYB2_FULL_48_7]